MLGIHGHSVVVCRFFVWFWSSSLSLVIFRQIIKSETEVDFIEVRKFGLLLVVLVSWFGWGIDFTLQIQRRNRKIEITEGKTHK